MASKTKKGKGYVISNTLMAVWVLVAALVVLGAVGSIGYGLGWHRHAADVNSAFYQRKAGMPILLPGGSDCTLLYLGRDDVKVYCRGMEKVGP